MAIQRVQSKWAKTKVLLQSEQLREYMPLTKRLEPETLRSMLDKYGMVYVKPVNGTFGHGVIRVEHHPGGGARSYTFQEGTSLASCGSYEELHRRLLAKIKRRPYLVQQGIELLRHQNRRFDIRAMVQKNGPHWETTGLIGRLAHPKRIVTNYHSGGTPMDLSMLMIGHLQGNELHEFEEKLRRLGVAIANQLQTAYPGLKEIGVDIAVDTKMHPWILEVNTLPDPFIFRKLKDKRVFPKIYRYAVAYGRFRKRSK
ncbi:YheC/YheD family protein [Paenibacillus protaetiae]|uniref:YheC/YheD family protein n=1 Tax=Paenibacillus protaetiae TaxID=2509456 RepID=A0A4P6F302_9BACL|nr:YheC/YheD family protein [Paenibacillus protaetiae]QAY67487.1 YheC/YheD family protein [Paenibacillus protaetiae]